MIVAPNEWTETIGPNPKRFLLYDNGPNSPHRIIVYATDEELRVLCEVDTLFMDGTFKTSPKLFMQLYVIHSILGNTTVPTVYSYLERKNRDTYNELFTAINNACHQRQLVFNPQNIHIDFEDAVIKAWRAVMGANRNVVCCFFHLCQNTFDHIRDLGLVDQYRDDDDFKLFCCSIDALAFLPEGDIVAGMAHLRANMPAAALPLINYFDQTYVNGTVSINGRHAPPQFPPELWSVYEETLSGFARTNNHSEAFNLKHKLELGHTKPTFWKSVNTIQIHQAEVATKIALAAIGDPPRKKKNLRYQRLQNRLNNLAASYSVGALNMANYIRGVARNIRLERE